MYKELKEWLKSTLNDPIVSLLLRYSNLTKIQFESVIIDLVADNLSKKRLKYEDKGKIRLKMVSRGAFNRSLRQARTNIISSIYTVLLLSYIGLLQGSPFEEYESLAEKLREYNKLYRSYEKLGTIAQRKLLDNIERELFKGVEKLSNPKSLKSS